MSGADRPLFLQGYEDGYCPAPNGSTTSIVSSRTNSTGGRSRQESIFSNNSHASKSSASSAPSTHTAALPFDQWQAGHIPPTPEASLDTIDPYMPCEFFWLSGCAETFRHDELQLCIDHIQETHFNLKHPHKLSCWWCDDLVFDSEEMNIPKEMVLVRRMEHIREHFIYGEYSITRSPRRQDLHMLKFLCDHGLISGDAFREYYRSEMPLPVGMQACDTGRRPLSTTGVLHDNGKDKRMRRRERQGKKASRIRR